ncbi:MAG: acyl carrier protein [Clostridia bacterium]|nr:acyl carrier protein [Clostridia bacterium]
MLNGERREKSMKRNILLKEIEELLELEEGTCNEETGLDEIAGWNSMAVINFIAFADTNYDKVLEGKDLRNSKTIGDLIDLILEG